MQVARAGLWIGDLPPELLQHIFRWVEPHDVVKIIPLVCKYVSKSGLFTSNPDPIQDAGMTKRVKIRSGWISARCGVWIHLEYLAA